MPIIIAGAGIGGLTAALSLARAGRKALVLERAAKIEEVGAGIQIAPNAGRVLAELGLEPALAEAGLEPRAINLRRGRDGDVLARLDLAEARYHWGAPFRVFHRADLHDVLLRAAQQAEGIAVKSGARVGSFEARGETLSVRVHTLAGLEETDASGLVGADGLRSGVRGHLNPTERDAPVYAGYAAWRALVPAEMAPAPLRARETNLWLMPGAHVVHYPLRNASLINVILVVDAPLSNDGALASVLALDGSELSRHLAYLPMARDLRALIEAGAHWRHWPLFNRPQLKQWSRGPVTLLGDAAHPMPPFLAQGAAQAIEDADALGRAFMQLGATAETAFAAYQSVRMARAAQIVRASRRQGDYFHMRPPASLVRDLVIRTLGGPGMLRRNGWLYR